MLGLDLHVVFVYFLTVQNPVGVQVHLYSLQNIALCVLALNWPQDPPFVVTKVVSLYCRLYILCKLTCTKGGS